MQMTVIPLVVSLVITGAAAIGGGGQFGRTGARVAGLFLAMAAGVAAVGTAAALLLVPRIPVVSQPQLATATAAPAAKPLSDLVISLVPVNPVQAAAEGAILPLLVFALAFGFALPRIAPEHQRVLISLFRGVAEAMLAVLGWVLAVAPVGVFALALSLAFRLGTSAVNALAGYVALLCAVLIGCLVLMYPLAVFAGGVPFRKFAAAMIPAQAIAFSTRTSLVALPALVEAAQRRLQLSPEAVGVVLPLAVSTLRLSTAAGQVISVAFAARLFGIETPPPALFLTGALAALLSFSVPGTASAGFLSVAAVLLQHAGVPLEALAILLALDPIPDMFKTALNVTGHMTAAAVAGRWFGAGSTSVSTTAAAANA
jgi:Na+/H+-dicarboxylate symporter